MKLQTVYKIVQEKYGHGRPSTLVSAWIIGPAQVKYAIGFTTYPKLKDSLLFAFESMETACLWYKEVGCYGYLYEAQAEVTEIPFTHFSSTAMSDLENIEWLIEFWKTHTKPSKLPIYPLRIPIGTVGCKHITLTKCLERLTPN